MLKIILNTLTVFILLSLSTEAFAAGPNKDLVSEIPKQPTMMSKPFQTFTELPTETSQTCAMHLTDDAHDIYSAVSPNVVRDSNLRKLVKKVVRPRVLSGKLSIKEAKVNAQAAGACLSLLKVESAEFS